MFKTGLPVLVIYDVSSSWRSRSSLTQSAVPHAPADRWRRLIMHIRQNLISSSLFSRNPDRVWEVMMSWGFDDEDCRRPLCKPSWQGGSRLSASSCVMHGVSLGTHSRAVLQRRAIHVGVRLARISGTLICKDSGTMFIYEIGQRH